MYKATRKLIEARLKFSPYVIDVVSNVKKIGGGEANDCLDNAVNEQINGSGVKVVSGWLVDRYNEQGKYTEITQHWWNVDAQGNHYDTTPNIDDDFEYVMDPAICAFGEKHAEQIETNICSSLVQYSNGTYLAINLVNNKIVATPIPDVSNESLFAHQLLKAA